MDTNKLKGIIPDNVIAQLPDVMKKYNINTELRLAHFLAQCSHESGNFKVVKENLNYSEERMLLIFKRDFDLNHDKVLSETEKKKAKELAHNPEKIANFVYANQNGNGNEASGDGYRYCGRGYIQLTGKANYAAFDKIVEEDIMSNPALVATRYPLLSAAFFFDSRKLWAICDKGSTDAVVKEVTIKVNGGTNGLQERTAKFKAIYKAIRK